MERLRSLRRPDVVAMGIAVALAGMVTFGVFTWIQQTRTAHGIRRLESYNLDVERAAWEIRWYDEVLTHSASRYVLSNGDPRWKSRYNHYIPLLDRAIARARRGADPVAFARLQAVDVANRSLVVLERRVFALVDHGDAPQAAALMAGEYDHQKAIYRTGLDRFFALQSAAFRHEIGDQRSRALRQRSQFAAATGLMLLVLVLLGLRYSGQRRQLQARDREREAAASFRSFERRLGHALEMALDEAGAFDALGAALSDEAPDRASELLLADSSSAHLHRAVGINLEGVSGCEVGSPFECPAIRRGQTIEFADSRSYDACPHLRRRDIDCSALCVPLSLDGRALGVLHSIGVRGVAAEADERLVLEESVRRTGDRVGLLRAFDRSESQARSDGLTGLLNRRSAADAILRSLDAGHDVAIAMADLDQFKALNDTHGHDAGDRALRLFSRILREEVRPNDIVSRWGGEEFVVALLGATADQAVAMCDRVRTLLTAAIDRSGVPEFSSSFGVTDSDRSRDLTELVSLADKALYRAKRNGRNRVEVAADEDNAKPSDDTLAV
jgi:diguanylate cyclase (GGDEF)-like protein